MFDAEAARKAGYSDAEIAEYLASQQQFDAKAARKAGYSDTELIAHLVGLQEQRGNAAQIPGTLREPEPEAPESIGDKLLGMGEAALTAITGATGGAAGLAAGTVAGINQAVTDGSFGTPQGARKVEDVASTAAQRLTYAPRTQAGQRYVQGMGEVLSQVVPVVPLAGELGLAGAASRNVGSASVPAVQNAARAVQRGVQEAQQRVMQRAAPQASPGTMGSVGVAGVDMATQRTQSAQSLPVPIKLTEGQKTRSFEQLRFEQESAKSPTAGQPLRDRYSQQNKQILDNFDVFMDQTGAEAPSLRAAGVVVDDALIKQAARDKAAYRVAYKEAEKAGELEAPVSTDAVVRVLNESVAAESTAPIVAAARAEIQRLGGASGAPGGLQAAELTLGNMEQLRKFINKAQGIDPTNQKFAADIKRAIDASTEGLGGAAYKRARGMRARYAQNYENRGTIAKLLDEKRGTADRAVALEDVFQHTILKSSLDDVRNVRRVLHRGGPEGHQAWKELQGQTMAWIRDEATKNVATDQAGNRIVSPAQLDRAIKTLDHDGKLDFIFGKKGAEQMRDINDLVKVVYTSPPGTVNTSNTASVLLAALTEAGVSGSMTGLPIPVLTGLKVLSQHVKNQRLRVRINQALGESEKKAPTPSKSK